jgi:CO/xanthine dehydrogenase FAD-binding subunit
MLRPATLAEALDLLATHRGTARLLAGGQSLVPMMNLRLATPEILIDLGRVAELRRIDAGADELTIGAMVRQVDLLSDPLIAAHAPLLVRAAVHIGHVQTRARGTVGGSLAHADPSAEIPTVMVALGATLIVRSAAASRRIPAGAFLTGALTTALADDEILCAVTVPKPQLPVRASFREMSRRHGDFAMASVAVQMSGAGDAATLQVALGGVAETPHLCRGLRAMPPAAGIAEAIARELEAVAFLEDIHVSAAYRRELAAALLADGLREVLG